MIIFSSWIYLLSEVNNYIVRLNRDVIVVTNTDKTGTENYFLTIPIPPYTKAKYLLL